ncbi:Probable 28S ribosomal protein S26, mitochondrial [Anthophora quadrimaculata]
MMRSSIICGAKTLTVQNLRVYDHLIFHGPCIQSVRWKKKPIWLPLAKSKLYKIPPTPVPRPEEYEELKRLHNNYKTLMKSLRQFFVDYEAKRAQIFSEKVLKHNAEEDFKICSYINDKWNKEVATLREQRLAEERELRVKEIKMKVEEKAERDLNIQERVDAEIRKAKEEVATFITRDNIDEAIKNALETIVNHNVAIDSNGNFYKDEPVKVASSAAELK